jgi:hypothetical protein
MSSNGEILLYQSDDGEIDIEVHLNDGTVWLSQAQMAELFQVERSVVTKHINNVIKSGELEKEGNVQKMHIAQSTKPVNFYNLDMIISVGYRVNSHRGVQFRIWATKTLGEYVVKGFVIDDDRLSGKKTNYFDELIERVRRIRTSEANFYEKVKAIFATSIDYQTGTDDAKLFYATVQNKFHYAITGFTAAEMIVNRVNAYKPKMGLVHTKGDQPTQKEAGIAKNYLEEIELKRLELLVEQFLSFAELQSIEKRPMYMADWKRKLDDFIQFNDKNVLTNAGKVSHQSMKQTVAEEFEIYARKLLEAGDETGETTKKDFKKALRKTNRSKD